MTPKTTLTARVTPDTRAALDRLATAGHTTTSELAGRVLTEWVAQQAAQLDAMKRVNDLLNSARDIAGQVDNGAPVTRLVGAIWCIINAIDVLAGTAPEEG